MRDGVGEALAVLTKEDKRIVVLDCDIGPSTRAQKVVSVAPDRFFNLGISEQAAMGIAAGLALDGYIPIIALFAVFAERGYEIFRNSIALENLPVLLIGTHAGVCVGEDGPTHQAVEDLPYFLALPNVVVFSPSSAELVKHTILHVIKEEHLPAYIRVARVNPRKDPKCEEYYHYAKLQDGDSGIAVVATGIAVGEALLAADSLIEDGVAITVFDVNRIKPVPEKLLQELKQFDVIITAEDHSPSCGFGTFLAAAMAEKGWSGKLIRIGSLGFGKSGKPYDVLEKYGPSAQRIANAVKHISRTQNMR